MEYTPHNITEKEIKWSYWWLNNIGNFKLFGFTVAYALVGLLWIFVLYGLITTGLNWNKELSYKTILNKQPKYQILANDAPQAFSLGTAVVLNAGQQKYDIVVPVTNSNTNWMVSKLKYFISYNDQATTTEKEIIVMAGQTNYLTAFSIVSERKPYNINIEIVDQQWRRTSKVNVLPVDFKINVNKVSTSEDGFSQHVESDIINNSLVNYWEVKWLAVGYSGYQPVAIQEVTTEEFLALSMRKVYFNWANRLPKIDRVEIVPQLNIFDLSLSYQVNFDPLAY